MIRVNLFQLWVKIYIFWLLVLLLPFGNSLMTFTIGFLPMNELLILVGFFIAIMTKTNTVNWYIFNILFFCILLTYFGIGFDKYGIVAGRDITPLINFLLFFIFQRVDFDCTKYFYRMAFVGLIFELLDRAILGPFLWWAIYVPGFSVDVPLFGGKIGSSVIIFLNLAFAMHYRTVWSYLILAICILLLVLHMDRFSYVTLFGMFILLSLKKVEFFYWLKFCAVLISVFLLFNISINAMLSLDIVPAKLLKYLPASGISVFFFLEHLNTIIGIESDTFSGSHDGVSYRLQLWSHSLSMMLSSPWTAAFGLGYGMPLTDQFMGTVYMREPHNSYVSAWSRLGLVGGTIFNVTVLGLYLKKVYLYMRNKNVPDLDGVLTLTLISSFVMALVQPAFELTPVASATFMMLGWMYRKQN